MTQTTVRPRPSLAKWQGVGMLVGFALALTAALLDARRNGPLSLDAHVWPMARLIAIAAVATVPVSAMLCLGWLAAARRVPALESRWGVRMTGLLLAGLLQSLLSFTMGALLTGRFREVWAITDRFAWLPFVPALVVLLGPVMAAWLIVPRVVLRSLRAPLVAADR